MNIIDVTAFEIDNLIAVEYLNSPDIEAKLTEAIEKYEPEFLREMFGYEFAKGLIAYVNDENSSPTPIYDNIIQGAEYTDVCGKLQGYEGIKRSIVHYVFWNYKSETITQSGDFGEHQLKAENSTNVSSIPRLTRVWNQMVENNISCYEYVQANEADYPTIVENGANINLISRTNEFGI